MEFRICLFLALAALTKAQTQFVFSCPNGYDLMGNECFRYFNDQEKFSDARSICTINNNGVLASIDSPTINAQLVDKYLKVNTQSVWIGYTDAASEGTWTWIDGSSSVYENWQSTPTANVGKNCALLTYDVGLNGKWIDEDCSLTKPFICKRAAIKTAIAPAPTPSTSGTCQSEWKQLGALCYRLTRGMKPWNKAQGFCEFLGGTLATVDSQAVQTFLQKEYMAPTAHGMWIGLNSQTTSGTWTWKETGQVATYFNWAIIKGQQQPDNVVNKRCIATENYRRKQMGKWNDVRCAARYWSICQKPSAQ